MTSLNKFETAILEKIADAYPAIKAHIPFLQIKDKELTGVGMYVNFIYLDENSLNGIEPYNASLSGNDTINIPSLKNGLCFELNVTSGRINFLEVVSYDEDWDGNTEGFSFAN